MGVGWKVLGRPLLDFRSGVRGEAVQDGMDLFARARFHGLLHRGQEVRGLAGRLAFADDFAGGGVQRGEQARGAVGHVVVGELLRGVGGDRQHRLGSVQRLDLRLLVDGQHHGAAWWLKVEPEDIGDLLRAWVLRELEGAGPGCCQILFAPTPCDVMPGHRDAFLALEVQGGCTGRPMGQVRFRRRRHAGRRTRSSSCSRRHLCVSAARILGGGTGETRLCTTRRAAVHRRRCNPGGFRDVLPAAPLGGPRHDPRARRHVSRNVARPCQLPQIVHPFRRKIHTSLHDRQRMKFHGQDHETLQRSQQQAEHSRRCRARSRYA